MKWPPWAKPEVRESYTDQIIGNMMSAASGSSDASLAAIEISSRWWGSSLSTASISPVNAALAPVDASFLDFVGRELVRHGESCHVLDVVDGAVELHPVSSWQVEGSYRRSEWVYNCNMSGPSSTVTRKLGASQVIHIRYGVSRDRPWKGNSPASMAAATLQAGSRLERSLGEELALRTQQMLVPRRSSNDFGGMGDLAPENLDKVVKALSQSVNQGVFALPTDLEPRKLGPTPHPTYPELRDRLMYDILSMHGVNPTLVAPNSTGQGLRESFRQFLFSTIRPVARLIEMELREKLEPTASLSFEALRGADIQGSARAYASLVKADMQPADAARIVGFEVSA